MAGEVEASAAYRAMASSGQKVLAAIEREIERGNAALSFETLMELSGLCRSAVRLGVKQAEALGFVIVTSGARRTSTFALAEAWRDLNIIEAKRLARLARGPSPPRERSARLTHKPQVHRVKAERPVEPEVEVERPVERRAPSLPPLQWLGG
jgi:hypothetical protein